MTAMFDDQAVHVSYIIDEVQKRGATTIEVDAEAEKAWVEEIVRLAGGGNAEFLEACTPGYYNREGQVGKGVSMQNSPYAPGINAFNDLLARWREAGTLDGMTLITENDE